MLPLPHNFQAFSRNLQLPLQRLVAICIPRKHNGFTFPVFGSYLFLQQFGGILFIQNFSLRIQACVIAPMLMTVSRVAEITAVYAPLIWIGRILHSHIWTRYLIDESFRENLKVFGVVDICLFSFPVSEIKQLG